MDNLLEVSSLLKSFSQPTPGLFKRAKKMNAVDHVSLNVKSGETYGLVGESGCGKSTLGQSILRLLEPDGGTIHYKGKSVTSASQSEMRKMRREMQIIFQDPYSSLNPRMNVEQILSEPFIIHNEGTRVEISKRVAALLEVVGLDSSYGKRFPHEFSGGQRQRIGIARAIALNPEFIVADEPVSALDVSIQAQVLNLIKDLKKRFSLSFIFIAHDLAVVSHISDRIGVMYLGKIVEEGSAESVFLKPQHPYTRALLYSIPMADKPSEPFIIDTDMPSPSNPPSGCRFHPRCPLATEKCKTELPEFKVRSSDKDHKVACHYV